MVNPQLFPSEFSNICPGKQIDETDPLADLRSQIIKLRNQHLMQVRKSGVSIAELQNQAIEVEQVIYRSTAPQPIPPPPPPVTIIQVMQQQVASGQPAAAPVPVAPPPPPIAGIAYVGGGENQAVHENVDKFVVNGEICTAVRWNLAQRRMRHMGASSSARGYWFGGQTTNNRLDRTTSIEAVNFATETRVAVGAVLAVARIYGRATESATRAYLATNRDPIARTIERFTFASESIANLGSSFTTVTGGCNAFKESSRGIWSSGEGVRAIETITFASETVNLLSAQLSVIRTRAAGFASGTRGYVVGGRSDTVALASIDFFRFATNSIGVLSQQTSAAQGDLEGYGSYLHGYQMGGTNTRNNIDALHFPTERWRNVKARLTRGGRYSLPVGRA